MRRADKKVLPATLPLTDQLLLRARRTELNFYGQGGNSFHHTLRYGHIGHTPNANPLGIIQQLRGPILTTYHPQMDNCGHFTYYLTCEEERTFYWPISSCPRSYWMTLEVVFFPIYYCALPLFLSVNVFQSPSVLGFDRNPFQFTTAGSYAVPLAIA